MNDRYNVTDGRVDRDFPFTREGLRAAWEFASTLRFAQITNPNRVDLRDDDSGVFHGLSTEDLDAIDAFEAGDEDAGDDYATQLAIDARRGK